MGAPREFLQGAQAEVPWVWTEGTQVLLHKTFSPEAFAWVVPLQNGRTRVGVMRTYERRWQALLAEELAVGLAFRKLYGWLTDRPVDGLLHAIARPGLQDLIRQKAHFDWHRELITAMGRSLPVGQLCRSLLFGL